ncbi:MAG: glycogen phosphorylase, partial [Firmicutes bacterium HGW-Firmicutes-12]
MIKRRNEFIEQYKEKFEMLHGKGIDEGTLLDKYTALAGLIKDHISVLWVQTNNSYNEHKQVYYLAMEFLPGKFLAKNINYKGMREIVETGLSQLGIKLHELEEIEYDAALGNGGLGRLGSCFLDSMASMGFAGHGCCLRYRYGLFKQKIVDGFQVELPENWLANGNMWEIRKQDKAVDVRFGGKVRTEMNDGRLVFVHEGFDVVKAVPYDVPIVGYDNSVVNTLRLWQAEIANSDLDMSVFTRGDYLKVLEYKQDVEAISQILYPDDSNDSGKILRLKQQYFLASAGLQSIVNRFKKKHDSLTLFADYVAIHLNDTHPVLCIPELMRILIDKEGMGWDEAWEITSKVMSYTNHTILPEALEKWPVEMIRTLLPRIYMIVEEINERNCLKSNDTAVISSRQVHMAHMAIIGSSKVNGVSKVHSELLKNQTMKKLYDIYPQKFNNKTNGVSHRRFLMQANPQLTRIISEAIGTGWVKKPEALLELNKYAQDYAFLEKLERVRKEKKLALTEYIQ